MPQRDPLDMVLGIATKFLDQAAELDGKVEAAIQAGAAPADIRLLLDLANSDRMRALAAAQAVLPFCHPRLGAIEVTPAPPVSKSSFEQRLETMSESEITAYLKGVANGTLAIAAIESEEPADGD
jgi:hypothetical protein